MCIFFRRNSDSYFIFYVFLLGFCICVLEPGCIVCVLLLSHLLHRGMVGSSQQVLLTRTHLHQLQKGSGISKLAQDDSCWTCVNMANFSIFRPSQVHALHFCENSLTWPYLPHRSRPWILLILLGFLSGFLIPLDSFSRSFLTHSHGPAFHVGFSWSASASLPPLVCQLLTHLLPTSCSPARPSIPPANTQSKNHITISQPQKPESHLSPPKFPPPGPPVSSSPPDWLLLLTYLSLTSPFVITPICSCNPFLVLLRCICLMERKQPEYLQNINVSSKSLYGLYSVWNLNSGKWLSLWYLEFFVVVLFLNNILIKCLDTSLSGALDKTKYVRSLLNTAWNGISSTYMQQKHKGPWWKFQAAHWRRHKYRHSQFELAAGGTNSQHVYFPYLARLCSFSSAPVLCSFLFNESPFLNSAVFPFTHLQFFLILSISFCPVPAIWLGYYIITLNVYNCLMTYCV